MPRSPTVLTPPPGTLPFVPNTTIESGKANAVWLDLYQDGNTPRPIVYGGTGASNAADALNNLGAIGQNNFLSAFSIGDGYWSTRNINNEGGVWLKRDGALYDSSDYPELALILPVLPDGVEWSNVAASITGTIRSMVITSGGYFVISNLPEDSTGVWRSMDGESYALVATIAGIIGQEISYSGGIYIVSGIGADTVGKIATSNDAITWGSPVSPSVGNTVFSCAYDGSVYVAVGNGGQISSSGDLVTWTPRSSGTTQSLRKVRYLNGNFVVVGIGGVITTSTNGTTFTLRTSGVTDPLFSVTEGAGIYVVVGQNGVILTSTNLSTWTPRASGTTVSIRDVVYSSSGFMLVGDGGVSRISTNGTSWTVTITGVTSNLSSLAFNPSAPAEYYALGGGSLIKGLRTLPTQFRVPNDSPQYGWIKAEND